ncbi:MAG: hypothetical protein AB1566_10480 [Chloroflexota bacterium]
MITKRRVSVVVLLAILVSIAVLSVAQASNPPSLGQPTYIVEQRPNGYLRVRVQVNLADHAARDRYAAQQRVEALRLARTGTGSVPVQITFIRPLSIEELHLLAQRTRMVAELVLFEARDADQGLHTVAARGNGANVVDLDSLGSGLNARSLRLIEATAMRGTVPASASGLGQLATDARVYLPDVTTHQLAIEVAARYGVSVDKVQVSLPTPHWYLRTERKEEP